MIKFDRNAELDNAMKNLMLSMIDLNKYDGEILRFQGKVLTPAMENELKGIMKKYNVPSGGLRYDLNTLTQNPYYRDIRLDSVSSGTVKYSRDVIKKRTLMSMGFNRPLGKYLFHYHPVGYFDEDIVLSVLTQGDKVWMSPAVSETDSMRDGIEKGHGKCLAMGLGIGVLPYMWLLKDEVESVTVIELNQDVIDLFNEYIRPQFKTDKSFEIIRGDAIDYYREKFLKRFDYVYADFWESDRDGLECYAKLMEKRVEAPNADFWIEDSMLYDIKYAVVPYLYTIYLNRSITDFICSVDPDSSWLAKKANRYFKSIDDTVRYEEQLLHFVQDKDVLRKILSQ